MKLIINIPEDLYGQLIKSDNPSYLEYCVRNGTPLDIKADNYMLNVLRNKTNGEVMQALFPNVDKCFSNIIDLNLWWNAKYKVESEAEE